jgi:hypothetical protein
MNHLTRKQRQAQVDKAKQVEAKGASAQPSSYLRRNGLPLGVLLAGLGFILPRYFWIGVGCFVVGAGLLAFDVWKEVVIPKRGKTSKIIFAIVCLLAAATFLFWLFQPVPLQFAASSNVEKYGPDSVLFGIPWSKDYAALHFKLKNPGPIDYDDFDAELSTDLMIEELRLTDGLASCSIAPVGERFHPISQKMVGGVPVGPVDMNSSYQIVSVGKNGEILYSGSTAHSYRIRCDKFPANSESAFLAAISVMNPFVDGKPPAVLHAAPRPVAWCTVKVRFATLGRPRSITISECKMNQDCR